MKLISRSHKKGKKQPVLTLQIRVIQTKGIDIFTTFDCSPVCYVTTNNYFTQRTQKLTHSNSKWNQIIKLTLPKNPTNDMVRIIVYDVIRTHECTHSSNSVLPSHTNSSASSTLHHPATSPTATTTPKDKRPSPIRYPSSSNNIHELSTSSLRTMYHLNSPPSTHLHSQSLIVSNNNNIQPQYIRSDNSSSSYNDISSSASPTASTYSNTHINKPGRYMYIGETQVSIHDLFRDSERVNQFNFNQLQHPKWYTLYDKKREKQWKDSTTEKKVFPIGDIQLAFALSSNMKRKCTTLQAFTLWQERLMKSVNGKRHRKLIKVSDQNESGYNIDQAAYTLGNSSLGQMDDDVTRNEDEEGEEEEEEEDDDIGYESLSQLNSPSMSDVSIISTSSIISSSSSIGMVSTTSNSDFEDSSFIQSGVNDDNESAEALMDLKSLVTALDEYDVVKVPTDVLESHPTTTLTTTTANDDSDILKGRAVINQDYQDLENILKESPSAVQDIVDDTESYLINKSTDDFTNIRRTRSESLSESSDVGYSEDFELSSDSENEHVNTSLQFKPNGSKLLRLKRRTKSNYYQHYDINRHWKNNFKVSKKQHSLGVVFMEIQHITDLPVLKNKLSRRKYDMDPFVITTFGRRVFKTSSKNHTVNPYFNEFLAFEIFPNETQFSFHFKVMDKDSFSYHDEVAEYDIPWLDILTQIKEDNKIEGGKEWSQFHLPLNILYRQSVEAHPILTIKVKYAPYNNLKRNFWKYAVANNTVKDHFDMVDLLLFLDKLGSFSDDDALEFFSRFNKLAWAGDSITRKELIKGLETWKKTSEFKNMWKCPRCFKRRKKSNNSKKSKLTSENDLITHFAICSFEHNDMNTVLKPSYVSSAFASKRWFTKILIKLSYGSYALGSNNANILVQDRDSGVILEEKISAHVKVGLRIIYNGKGTESRKFKNLLKTMSIRQGTKFDNPASVKQIDSFIKFHHLDMSQCLDTNYSTFNEFFYRKLKPGSRVIESKSPKYMVCPADSRLTVFASIEKSKEIWIKSSKFTINRLTKGYNNDRYNNSTTSMAIFRLAPQDYHRFHSPCDVTIGKPIHIDGEYYTVNPMAIRSELDVFGENVRTIIPLKSEEFGEFLMIAVGAMMVGSIVLTCKEGDQIAKGEEIGYFKFGGSTIILLVPTNIIKFDSDLINNTTEQIETLVKVGMSLGHTPDVKAMDRKRKKILNSLQLEKIKRTISVTAENISKIGDVTWQYDTVTNLMKEDYDKDEIVNIREEK